MSQGNSKAFPTYSISDILSTIDIFKNAKNKSYLVSIFGNNSDVDTGTVPESIWENGGLYTGFPTGSGETFDTLSSDVNDTSGGTGARTWRWYYLDDNLNAFDANGNWLTFDVTLNGTTPVTSGVSGRRIWDGHLLTAGSGNTNAGNITVRNTTTTANVFAVVPAGNGRMTACVFTIPSGYTGYLTRYSGSMLDTTSNKAVVVLKSKSSNSNTYVLNRRLAISTEFSAERTLIGAEQYLEKTDLEFIATTVVNNNANVIVTFDLVLIKN